MRLLSTRVVTQTMQLTDVGLSLENRQEARKLGLLTVRQTTFALQSKVSKPDASAWSRRSVRRVFSRDNPTSVNPIALFGVMAIVIVFSAQPAFAMHISEGILPAGWAGLWFAVALPFVAWGLYELKKRSALDVSFKPLVGLMAAVVFIISCMPVPVPTAGTCSHPCGTGLAAILLGPALSVLVAFTALLIQALFLSHGGLSTLGANVVSMGIVGSFTGYLFFRLARSVKINLLVAGFLAGLFADWATYLMTSVELASGIRGSTPFLSLLWKIAIAFVPTQLPLGILEGAITAGMVGLLYKKRPDLLVKMKVLKAEEAVS